MIVNTYDRTTSSGALNPGLNTALFLGSLSIDTKRRIGSNGDDGLPEISKWGKRSRSSSLRLTRPIPFSPDQRGSKKIVICKQLTSLIKNLGYPLHWRNATSCDLITSALIGSKPSTKRGVWMQFSS
jgi:hypothetical protein